MSEEAKNNTDLVIVDTKDKQVIDTAYEMLGKYFKPSELESEDAILERTLGEQSDSVKHGVLVAYRGDRMVCCCIYDHFVDTQMVYVEYIATEVDERRHHVATELLQQGIFGRYEADILVDIVDPKKMEDATQEEKAYVESKSKFWSKQGARKLGIENFQQPDFEQTVENGVAIDDGSFLALIPRNEQTCEVDGERMAQTLHTINTECNGVEDPESAFPQMFDELKLKPVITLSSKPLIEDVAASQTADEEFCQ